MPMKTTMNLMSRRDFVGRLGGTVAAAGLGWSETSLLAQLAGQRPDQDPKVKVLNPRRRVPVSLIIDDSTCLVNLAHFAIPQFQVVFPNQYRQPWRNLPREIPDAFVRKFGEWCAGEGVKGKYSVVPCPACVGWIDRELPGWSRQQLKESLNLVRSELAANWDFHPEMVTHTWVIDTRTGRPYPGTTDAFMENWRWTDGKSVDELADYLSYALRLLKNVDLPCEGITTPGGFGNRVLPELAQATLESCRDVFRAEIPHYFRHLYTDERSVAPRVEYASGLEGDDPRCVVSIIGCTGDWFGGWDGLEIGSVDQFITANLEGGRLPEVIQREEPAIMVCHWPGIYTNGDEKGFKIFQEVVRRLKARYDNLIWMKLSEIARYWAARQLTQVDYAGQQVTFQAPYACPGFTMQVDGSPQGFPHLEVGSEKMPLSEIRDIKQLRPGTWSKQGEERVLCFDLPKGASRIVFA